MPKQPSIAILGAGPAGLTAANVLQKHGWQSTVFESDASVNARDQGGSLDLHPTDGQLALKKAGLFDAFMALARHEDQENRIVDYCTGALLRLDAPEMGEGDRPEIDRSLLRELLLAPLPPGVVKWNTPISEVISRPDGMYELIGPAGQFGPFDLVIGADGAWSKARAALTDQRPHYTGVTFVELWLEDVDLALPMEAALVGHGTLFSLHDNVGIIAQRNGNHTIRVYAAFRTTASETDRPDKTLSDISKAQIIARFDGWAPALLSLISNASQIAAVRPLVTLPADARWEHRDGLTLIGDAAHVMPPLGVGVNLAMLDAAELAESLVSNADWRQAVKEAENNMLQRASDIAAQCIEGLDAMFSDRAEDALLDDLDGHK